MNGVYEDQILTEKLSKLNNSQQSIETLSHWCIFHRKRAAQVVRRWEKDFQQAPQSRKLCFLYLANDILQNSRRKGQEFVNEFWKVLPGALKDIVRNGNIPAQASVDRLLGIWEERKVFGPRTCTLKEAFLGTDSASAPSPPVKERSSKGKAAAANASAKQAYLTGPLEKIGAAHAAVQEGASEEEAGLRKCSVATAELQALEKQAPLRAVAGPTAIASVAEELQTKQTALLALIGQLETCEKRRALLVNLLREALRTQESKLERIRAQVQASQAESDQALTLRHRLSAHQQQGDAAAGMAPHANGTLPGVHYAAEQAGYPGADLRGGYPGAPSLSYGGTPVHMGDPQGLASRYHAYGNMGHSGAPGDLPPGMGQDGGQMSVAHHSHAGQVGNGLVQPSPGSAHRQDDGSERKREAAELAVKLSASTTSAAMLSSVLASLAREGHLTGVNQLAANFAKGNQAAFLPQKRAKLEDGSTSAHQGAPGAGRPSGEGGAAGGGGGGGATAAAPHLPPSSDQSASQARAGRMSGGGASPVGGQATPGGASGGRQGSANGRGGGGAAAHSPLPGGGPAPPPPQSFASSGGGYSSMSQLFGQQAQGQHSSAMAQQQSQASSLTRQPASTTA
eukprot:TRINITY_DN9817_c0_g1_i3.p1 TRINITY_DN9817_c0_g1~~TRINITY_DN9817_c0_g1_i3.p1  ORF type:complete len:624 (+),score=162.58 TRINITY_DN9817_c0_g1_i3:199-2070(+)